MSLNEQLANSFELHYNNTSFEQEKYLYVIYMETTWNSDNSLLWLLDNEVREIL